MQRSERIERSTFRPRGGASSLAATPHVKHWAIKVPNSVHEIAERRIPAVNSAVPRAEAVRIGGFLRSRPANTASNSTLRAGSGRSSPLPHGPNLRILRENWPRLRALTGDPPRLEHCWPRARRVRAKKAANAPSAPGWSLFYANPKRETAWPRCWSLNGCVRTGDPSTGD